MFIIKMFEKPYFCEKPLCKRLSDVANITEPVFKTFHRQ